MEKKVIASIVDCYKLDSNAKTDFSALKAIFSKPVAANGQLYHHRKRL